MLKIPVLVFHFITYYKHDPTTTLRGFIAEHYSDEMVFDDDWLQDMQLPFKTCESAHSYILIISKTEILSLPNPKAIIVTTSFTPKLRWLHSNMQVQKIFQPPRCA